MLAGAAIAAALVWAQGARAGDEKADQTTHMQQPGSQSAGTAAGRESTAGGADRTSREMRSDARAESNPQDRKGEFQGKKNFDVDGKVKHASASEVTIERKGGLPPMKLKVGSDTKIEVDGKRASADQLQPGQDVKASFNMKGETPEAVELKAKKADEKDRQKLMEQQRDNEKDRAKDAQKQR
jgi:hypothetical protein